MSKKDFIRFSLTPQDNEALQNLAGWHEEHFSMLETRLGIEIHHLGFDFRVSGNIEILIATEQLIRDLYAMAFAELISTEHIHLMLTERGLAEKPKSASKPAETEAESEDEVEGESAQAAEHHDLAVLRPKRKMIRARTVNQHTYIRNMLKHDINFGIGPAGTGKTYMAVARAVELLETEQVRRLILTRPAVEAGEKLGFLPGDLAQKVDPYLRPLYDALFELLGFEKVERLMERNVIEVAPLAFMRGRTLNESCIILDEAQNTTLEQMKMFLTRVGFGSKVMITGDMTQVDLPSKNSSGLRQAVDILQGVEGIAFTFFNAQDVVRHPLVQRVIEAYERFEKTSQ